MPAQPPRIRIGLVEDQQLFRQGIKAILNSQPDLEVTFESPEAFPVVQQFQQLTTLPEVLLLDLTFPPHEGREYSGQDLTLELKKHFPTLKILVLSVHEDLYIMAKLIESGANGYLLKDSDPEEVFRAIRDVHTNGSYINERTLRALQGRLKGDVQPQKDFEELSHREIDVLKLICQQLTTEEIGEQLFISPKTVNGHRYNLLQKTGSKNVTGLVLYAVKHQLIELV